jgi:energy-coupling factor transporter ATP-binding protein EcfA2
MTQQIVALVGPAGSGKTTLARLLEAQGFTRTSFAAPIKAMIAALLFYQKADDELVTRMLNGDLKEIPSPFLANQTPRYAMQTLGTEWRELIHRKLWLFVWNQSIANHDRIVVDDVRFKHEAEFVRALGGQIFRVCRPGFTAGKHISELEYASIYPDALIQNDHEPEYMLAQLTHLIDGEVP